MGIFRFKGILVDELALRPLQCRASRNKWEGGGDVRLPQVHVHSWRIFAARDFWLQGIIFILEGC
jgi:hypothetical protein